MRCLFGCLMGLTAMALGACDGKGGECAEPSDVAGVWEFRATAISDSCSGLASYTFPMTIAQNGSALSGENPGGTLAGTLCGDRIQMSGSVPGLDGIPGLFSGGTTTANLQLTVSADGNSMEGSDTWNWTIGSQNCQGSESLSGTRAGDDVCDWGFGCPCERPLDEYCEGSSCPTYEQALAAAETSAAQGYCVGDFGVASTAGRCGDLRYVHRAPHEEHLEYFDASGTLVAAYWWTDDCGHVCRGSCSVNYGARPECELEQERDFCDQNDVSGFANCVYPSTDDRCECYPFGDFPTEGPSCGPGESCSLRFLEGRPDRFPTYDLPALDGSDGTRTTECVADAAQPDLRGEPCSVLTESVGDTVSARRDTCAANLFCDLRGVCVTYCELQDDCFPDPCTPIAYGPDAPIGICAGGSGGEGGADGFGGFAGSGGADGS